MRAYEVDTLDAGGVADPVRTRALLHLYPICTQIFAIIYTFWDRACLLGPLVLASALSSTVNSLSKYYTLNLVVWNAWTVLYAVFGCLSPRSI